MPVIQGVVTFYGLTLNVAASGYRSGRAAAESPPRISSPITVVNPPSRLAVKLPTSLEPSPAIGPSASASRSDDAFGGPASDYNGNVTIALSGKRGKAKLRGVRTVRAVDGVANFSGLTPERGSQGRVVQLRVTADGLAAATTNLSIGTGARPLSGREDPRHEMTGIAGLNRPPAGPRRRGRRSHPRSPSGP